MYFTRTVMRIQLVNGPTIAQPSRNSNINYISHVYDGDIFHLHGLRPVHVQQRVWIRKGRIRRTTPKRRRIGFHPSHRGTARRTNRYRILSVRNGPRRKKKSGTASSGGIRNEPLETHAGNEEGESPDRGYKRKLVGFGSQPPFPAETVWDLVVLGIRN